MSDLTIYSLGFDSNAAMADIRDIIDVCLDELSVSFQEIIRREIMENGNGSGIMKAEAVKHVREMSRSFKGNIITLEVGVDESEPESLQAKIRTSVVLHGNITGGPLYTKPGQSTWKKHVVGPSESTAKTVYHLAQFEQTDVSGHILSNSMKKVKKHIAEFLAAVSEALDLLDWSEYITGGG